MNQQSSFLNRSLQGVPPIGGPRKRAIARDGSCLVTWDLASLETVVLSGDGVTYRKAHACEAIGKQVVAIKASRTSEIYRQDVGGFGACFHAACQSCRIMKIARPTRYLTASLKPTSRSRRRSRPSHLRVLHHPSAFVLAASVDSKT